MTRIGLSLMLILPIAACSGSAVPVGDLCEKLMECGFTEATTMAECEAEMQALKDVIRGPSWNALAECLLDNTCEELSAEDGIMGCLEAAAQAAPQGVGDSFLEAYCQRMIDCGQYLGSVDDCVNLMKQQAGDYLGMLNMFTDSLINCMEDCTAELSCEDLNNFFEICGLECELPFVDTDLDCDHGYQEGDVCVCDRGWAGTLCDECAEGYFWNGRNCVAECQPDSCSGHGLCDDSSGHLVCTCDTGYAGEACESCAEGYLEVEGRCRPTAGCDNDGVDCDDGLICTVDDVCSQDVCLGTDLDCDDGVACTIDTCMELTGGCHNEPVPTDEPEGYLGDPVCENGKDDDCDGATDADDPDCLTLPCTTASDCPDDLNPCTQAVCDAKLCFWPPVPDASPCPGSDECTSQYICRGTECLPDYPDTDADNDGFVDGDCLHGFDCDDSDPDTNPGTEGPEGDPTCSDGLDNDCDGLADAFDQSCWPMECTAEGWCLEQPRTGSAEFNTLWAVAPDDVWAASKYNSVVHWDSSSWKQVESPEYWGFNDMCGCASNDMWAAGQTGVIFYWDGLTWEAHTNLVGVATLNGIWCNCESLPMSEAWAVGRPGAIMRYDGAEWTLDDYTADNDLNAVWGTGTGEVWAVGRGGLLVHYVNSAWQSEDSGTVEYLNGVWGRSPTEVWAVGSDGTILYYSGSGWTSQNISSMRDLEHIWGPDDGSGPFAVGGFGNDGLVLEYSAGVWTESDLFGSAPSYLYAVGGTAQDDLWAVGRYGTILHSDGVQATDLSQGVGYFSGICADESPDGKVRAWALGQSLEAMLEWNGAGWQVTRTGWEGGIRSYWCGGPHGIWTMNSSGDYLHFGASVFETGEIEDLPMITNLYAMSGRMNDQGLVELWVVGRSGLAVHHDGHHWEQEHVPDTWEDMTAVWVGPKILSTYVFAAGKRGMLATRDASGWTVHPGITDEDLNAVWGDGQGAVWIVGGNSTVLRWTGSGFVPEEIPVENVDLTDIQGTGRDDFWIAGDGVIVRFASGVWSTESFGLGSTYHLAVTPSHIWAVEGRGSIYHKIR